MAATGRKDPGLRSKLLDVYLCRDTYPEVKGMLQALKDAGLRAAILSNGSPFMLGHAVRSAGLDELLDELLSANDIGAFKPDPNVYLLAEKALEQPLHDQQRLGWFRSGDLWVPNGLDQPIRTAARGYFYGP